MIGPVSRVTYGLPTVGWLGLGGGAALAVIALVGLIAHEVAMERPLRHPRSLRDIERELAVRQARQRPEVPVAS